MTIAGSGFSLAGTVVLGVGSSIVGTIGTVAELVVKEINKTNHPRLRAIGEVFSKTLQTTPAAAILLIIGSLAANKVGVVVALGIGTAMILTPIVNGIIQHSSKNSWKQIANRADRAVSAFAKTINTAILTLAVFKARGIVAGTIAGVSLIALSVATYKKA